MYLHPIKTVLALLLLGMSVQTARAQQLYSYVDENGIRNFTNIPPARSVRDLKVSGSPLSPPTHLKIETLSGDEVFNPIISRYAQEFQIDPQLIRSMISTESAFNPRAVSRKGASGLMQLMPATAARVGVRNVFSPDENIRGGTQHMRNLLDRFNNDLTLSLAAYNAGENLVERVQRVPNIRETQNYVKSVTRRYNSAQQIRRTEAEPQPSNRIFRYRDSNGVLHLTNIAPGQ